MINTLIIDGRVLKNPLVVPDALNEQLSVRLDIEHQSRGGKTPLTVIVRDDLARTVATIVRQDDIVRVVGALVGHRRNKRWTYLMEAHDVEKRG